MSWGEAFIDTRKHPGSSDPAQYRARKRAQGHKLPLPDDFALAPAAAINRIVALEAAHPQILPAGFRDRLLAEPLNASLREQVARCELQQDMAVRRAGYDAMMAVLLGAARGPAIALLTEARTALYEGANTRRPCGPRACAKGKKWCAPCPSPKRCDSYARICLAPNVTERFVISETQLQIEHVLSQGARGLGLFKHAEKAQFPSNAMLIWSSHFMHRCGRHVCKQVLRQVGNKTQLVRWDIRDGGLTMRLRAWMSAERKNHCRRETGAMNEKHCRRLCQLSDDESTDARCYRGCQAHCANDRFELLP